VQWLIGRQTGGDPLLNFDPALGPVAAPWLAWGPYLWADGLTARSDGLTWACSEFATDGTHPATAAQLKVADSLLAFFRWDETTAPWYRVPGQLDAGPIPARTDLALAAAPNPTAGSTVFTLTAPRGAAWKLEVVDAAGRRLHSAAGVGSGAPERFAWDGRTMGRAAAPGACWARLEAAGRRVGTLLVRLSARN